MNCNLLICSDLIASNQSDCESQIPLGCLYNNSNSCIEYDALCKYDAKGDNDLAKRSYCNSLVNAPIGSAKCQYLTGNIKCSIRICSGLTNPENQAACNAWMSGCIFVNYATPCISPVLKCAYPVQGNNFEAKL